MPRSQERSMHPERGMTLIEVLVGFAVATLVLAACYGSYVVVTDYYRTQGDISNVRQTIRQTLELVNRDVQAAGFVYLETAGGAITEPLSLINGGGTDCTECDTLFIIFDKCTASGSGMSAICDSSAQFTRRVVKYEVRACGASNIITRTNRLCRIVMECRQGQTCADTTGIPNAWTVVDSGSVVADRVEDLQFAFKTAEGQALPAGNGASAHSLDIGIILATQKDHGNPRQLTTPGNWQTNFQSSYAAPTDRKIRDWGMTSVLLRNNAYIQG